MSDQTRIMTDPFTASVVWPRSGLVGNLGFTLVSNGVTVNERTTSRIVEYPAGSGVYTITGQDAPANGTYQGIWDDEFRYESQDIIFDLADWHRRFGLDDPALRGQIETVATELRGLSANPVLNAIESSNPDLEILEVT